MPLASNFPINDKSEQQLERTYCVHEGNFDGRSITESPSPLSFSSAASPGVTPYLNGVEIVLNDSLAFLPESTCPPHP